MAETTDNKRSIPDQRYANNVRFENSVWDMKALFGVLDQSVDPATVNFHTAVNMPWMQAKIAAYFMCMQIIFHETANGPIHIPASVKPPRPEEVIPELATQAPDLLARLQWLRTEFFGEDTPSGEAPKAE